MGAHVPPYGCFSAEVRLELRVGNEVFNLASIGPDEVISRDKLDLDHGCEAEIVMYVDGEQQSWLVELPDGAVPFERVVKTRPSRRKIGR